MSQKRLSFCDIDVEVFNGVDGSVMNRLWEVYNAENKYFSNPSYLGCAVSHLSIYADAISKNYEKILIIEDDVRIKRDANEFFSKLDIPSEYDLLYLGFIPLTDDCSQWNYNVFKQLSANIALAKNFWGLYGYGISKNLMTELLEIYNKSFPMELDRYFVTEIQPRQKSFGIIPQIFAADDGFSDNSRTFEHNMLERSIDQRFAKLTDYI